MTTSQRFRAVAPLALSIGVIAFIWSDLVLNFSFHWAVVKDGVFGKFGLPASFSLILPASFVSWGLFFALGANTAALRKTVVAAAMGTLAAGVIMVLGPALADAPKFWGVALSVGIAAFLLVAASSLSAGDLLAPAAPFICTGTILLWWFATGLDNYVPGGKGPHTVAAMTAAATSKPLAAGTGAFGGLLSTSWLWVEISVLVSFVCGALLGPLSTRVASIKLRRPAVSSSARPTSTA
jgi:hypothetical protein